MKVSQDWGLVPFYETSAMYKTNVDEAFIDVVRQIMRKEAAISEKKQQKELQKQQQQQQQEQDAEGQQQQQKSENPNRLQHKRMQQQMAKQMSCQIETTQLMITQSLAPGSKCCTIM